jgi:hypothetical protein
MGRVCNTTMTRKDQMREGYVSRNFHIPTDIDNELRMEAVKKHIRFSDMAILAFRNYLQNISKMTSKK